MRALEETLDAAGAAFVTRGSGRVAAHFGSAAGEMAVCRCGVGVADRSDMAKHELRGAPHAVSAVVERLAGTRPAPGRAVRAAGAWWCPVTRHRVLVLADAGARAGLGRRLAAAAAERPGASTIDLSDDYAAIALVGPRATRVARDGGVLGAVAPAGGFWPRAGALGGHPAPVLLLCEAADRLLLLVPDAHARAAWAHLMRAGRPYGATCVGRDALERLRAVRAR